MKVPVTVWKVYRGCCSEVRSPFNLTQDSDYDDELNFKNTLLNFWNVNQTFLIDGTSSDMKLRAFAKAIQNQNPFAKVYINSKKIHKDSSLEKL